MSWVRVAAGFVCVFLVAVSANIFAATLWDRLANVPSPTGLSGAATATILLASVVVFAGAAWWLYHERHRILDTQVSEGQVEPRPVLITGLSALNPTHLAVAERLLARVVSENLSINALIACVKAGRLPADEAALPWIQNIRALGSHQSRIERLVVVPSRGTEPASRDSAPQFPAFRTLILALIANTAELAGRGIEVVPSGEGARYDTHGPIRLALEEAKQQVLATPRKTGRHRRRDSSPNYGDADITFDMTPGTKAFSVAVVLVTLGAEGRCLYVDNNGDTHGVNGSVRLGSAFH